MARVNRFYIKTNLVHGTVKITDTTLVHQIKNVLRLQPGSALILFNGDGTEWQATIQHLDHSDCTVTIIAQQMPETEAPHMIHAGLALLKKERFELAAQKLVELGIASITPIIPERTIKTGLDWQRTEKIMIEAAEQSGRLIIPQLKETVSVTQFLDTHTDAIAFHMNGTPVQIRGQKQHYSFLVGPEGGWSDAELTLFSERNVPLFSLGNTVLRAETAAIVAAYELVWR